jgi:LysR family glycine cleavage system transcriptional activator
MQTLRSSLPTPNHLVTFVSAARHLSFTRSAEELNVSRVAVSQQIKALEAFLGVTLFHRLHRALSLTQAGETYFEEVSQSLERIKAATQAIRAAEDRNRITVTATTGFTTYWLMPRIGEFRALHPEIDLRFLISDKYLDLHTENIDVAVRYGDGDWDNLDCTFLQRERIFPVCSTTYLAGRERFSKPEDLLNENLLFLEGRYDEQTRWPVWFREQGVEVETIPQGITVNTYSNLVQATIDAQGIALIGPPVIEQFLNNGTLIRPLNISAIQRRAFYLVTPAGSNHKSRATVAFCNWVIENLGQSDTSTQGE